MRVRYIGMNTPETNEPCGSTATNPNASLVANQDVTLIKDVSETDRYGRLLRYVYVGSLFVNAELVRTGYAQAATYPPDVAHSQEFVQLESAAREGNLGCWATSVWASSTSAPAPTQSSGGGSTGGDGGTAVCNCSGPDLDCGDFSTHASAQACHDYCQSQGYGDVFGLDGNDNDGLACESLP